MSKKRAVLFDFDGVIMDTETIYTEFWDDQGKKYLNIENFGKIVKGRTDDVIYKKYFTDHQHLIPLLDKEIDHLENTMPFNYIRGAEEFMLHLKAEGVKIGMATSSNNRKMEIVFGQHPRLKELLDYIVTVDMVSHPKPNPECYQKAMEYFNASPKETVIFEDSIYGLQAARDAGAVVVGLTTTSTSDEVAHLSDYIIPDFDGITYDTIREFLD